MISKEKEKESNKEGTGERRQRGRWSEAMASCQRKQNSSRAEKLNTKKREKRKKGRRVVRPRERATAGSMWPSLRLSVQQREMKGKEQGTEEETAEEGVRAIVKKV